ncbi:MAG: DUF1775 domain-containing protein [Alphaproteobacteria bacterium]|nr:DUF1775 domain-containing protein [Alphaproteobacteria bacterium]
MRIHATALAGVLMFSAAASAHVVIADPIAAPGAYHAAYFRIGHGCDASTTIAVRVEIPESVALARPQPKPGWTLEIERAPRPAPVMVEGRAEHDRVAAVTWRGALPADQFDEFGLLVRAPVDSGPIYFPVTQTCAEGERRWTQIPAPGQAWHSVTNPAPVLTVTAPAAPSTHAH